jgi:hypothetical protein
MTPLIIVDAIMIGVFTMLIASLLTANGNVRRWTIMLVCIAIEVSFALVALFFDNSTTALTLRCTGRSIELTGVMYYFLRRQQAVVDEKLLSEEATRNKQSEQK